MNDKEYRAKNRHLAATDLGKDLWVHLNERDSVVRLETATDLGRPAVEGIARDLKQRFGTKVQDNQIKQMIGHMVKQILMDHGFSTKESGIEVRTGGLFSTGTRYERVSEIQHDE